MVMKNSHRSHKLIRGRLGLLLGLCIFSYSILIMAQQQQLTAISPGVMEQIAALETEKESRTPAQQKIDSQLLYALKMQRGESITSHVQTLTANVSSDETGLLTVDIIATVDDELMRQLAGLGVEVSYLFPQQHSLRAKTTLDQLETIALLPQVRFIQPKQEATYYQNGDENRNYPPIQPEDLSKRVERVRTQIQDFLSLPVSPDTLVKTGIATSEGDTTHKAFSARGTFNTDGTGVKIGVLSNGVKNLLASQSSGDLGPVTVLPGQAGSGDEGTAMLEVIHDLAPGAQLFFATAEGGIANFAQNIRNLRGAGCDIILDDVGYFVESPFQDGQTSSVISNNNGGLATQAVNDVVSSGAIYFSAAGNSGNADDTTSSTWEGDFTDGGTLSLLPGGKVHDFDPGSGVSQFNEIKDFGILTNLHWADPLGGSGNDYDLFVLNNIGTEVIAASTNIQNGSQDPYEQVFTAALGNRVVILQKNGAANRFLHVSTNRARLSFNTDGETHGHNAASRGYGVGAVCAICTFPSVFNSANAVEKFSSDGPRRVFFNADATAITPGNFSSSGGKVLQKPDIMAADGVSVSGAGGFPFQFYGTSAAAPHAAAIVALIKSANPALTPAAIRAALTATAVDIEAGGNDRSSGAGIVMPYEALQSLGAPVVGRAFIEIASISKPDIKPGETGDLIIALKNTGSLAATGVSVALTSSTSGVSIVNGYAAYPNLNVGAGSGANDRPLTISLGSSMPSDPNVNFTLTINYLGGHNPSQSWEFTVLFTSINGGFETGDFTHWNVSTVSTGGTGTPYKPWNVSRARAGGYLEYGILPTSPEDGLFGAWNGFDGAGPMEFRMYQDITFPSSGSVYITWKDRTQWFFLPAGTLPRTYNVQIRDPNTDNVRSTLYRFSTGTTSRYHDTGWLTHVSDLSPYAGQRIRLYFLEVIPQNYTGPGQLEIDSIIIGTGPMPANPIDQSHVFVNQQYLDFLNREPDPDGFLFWLSELRSCGNNQPCIEVKRINVSAAFFLSIEFQQTGYLVERSYKAAYGDLKGTSTRNGSHQLDVPVVRFNEFLSDSQKIGEGVVVLQPGWEEKLESNKQAFFLDFVQRPRFTAAFPDSITPEQFVDRLNQNAGNVLSSSERTQAVSLFGGSTYANNKAACAQALRLVAENQNLSNAEFNRAFVLMEYFGYLRRDPNTGQDTDYTGYDFWLTKLNSFNGNFVEAEMVKAFISSLEYRQRFGA